MKILAVETSCDDTCISISKIKNINFELLSNIVSSQVKIHQKWGGVYPSLAKREHQKNLTPVLVQALKEAKLLREIPNSKHQITNKFQAPNSKFQTLKEILIREEALLKQLKTFLTKYKKPEINLIAVTVGPGLEPCLWVGVKFAKALAYSWNLPVIPINHIEAHILANWLPPVGANSKFTGPSGARDSPEGCIPNSKNILPAVCLVVSGGHTQLILMKKIGNYKIIGETRDDAAGECFDKTARILGLGYPGGPAIAAEAAKLSTTHYKLQTKLPRPMIHQKNYDFSFSGLKTAVLYKVKSERLKIKDEKYIQEMCYEIQQAVIDVLIKKTIKAAKDYKAKSIILGGGVAANKELRKQFTKIIEEELPNIQYLIPNIQFCTDNAAMVGATAYYHWLREKTKPWKDIEANANLRLS